MVKFDLVRPCSDCPFRTDGMGFGLRSGRVLEILGSGRGRGWWPAPSFPCHKTIDYGARVPIGPRAQQCAGVMIILTREKRPNDAMQIGERLKLFDPSKLDLEAPVYHSTADAVAGQRRGHA